MAKKHKLVKVSSHMTHYMGRVRVAGLCRCGWIGGEEGDTAELAVRKFRKVWEFHRRTAKTPTSVTSAQRADMSSAVKVSP